MTNNAETTFSSLPPELTVPLTNIVLALDILEAELDREDQQACLKIIRSNMERLTSLIKNDISYQRKADNYDWAVKL